VSSLIEGDVQQAFPDQTSVFNPISIECVQTFIGRDPDFALGVFTDAGHLVAVQTVLL
jgi:hypothetical protein